jgi:hypothetical protein
MEKFNNGHRQVTEGQVAKEKESEKLRLDFEFERLEKTQQEQINVIVETLRGTMIDYLHLPKGEPRMLSRIEAFNHQLSQSLFYAGAENSNGNKVLDLEAALIGARVAIDHSMESRSGHDIDPNFIEPSKHFLGLVNNRVRRDLAPAS